MIKVTYSQSMSILEFGAASGEGIDNTMAIQEAINECSKSGKSLIFPPGVFMTGTIQLKSNVNIILSKNSIWKGIPDLSLYPDIHHREPDRLTDLTKKSMIYAVDVDNISISGGGTIYPNGDHEEFQDGVSNSSIRPYGILFVRCNNIKISDIKMKHSAFWMQRYLNCENLRLENLDVYNHANLNNDGVDIDGCRNVFVSNCKIDASDDALCLKTEGYGTTEDVVITNCILSSHASAFKLGTGSVSDFRRITFSNSVIRPSESKEIHHELKYSRGLVGIELLAVDGGGIEDILIDNIIIDSIETPFHIKLGNRHGRVPMNAPEPTPGHLRNVALNNIIVREAGKISSIITGYPENYIENISFSNIYYENEGGGTIDDIKSDIPEASSIYPVNLSYGVNFPSYAFFIRHARNISFENINIKLLNHDERSVFVLDDVKDIRFQNIEAQLRSTSQSAYVLKNVQNIKFFNSSNFDLVNKFISITGEGSKNIWLDNDEFELAEKLFPPKNFQATALSNEQSYIKLEWQEPHTNNGGLFYFTILRDGKRIAETRQNEFVDFNVQDGSKLNYEIFTNNYDGSKSKSSKLSVVSKIDLTKPRIISSKIIDNETIYIKFNEELNEDVGKLNNIHFSPPLVVNELKILENGKDLIINTNPILPNTNYILEFNSLKDLSLNGNEVNGTSINLIDKPLAAYWSFENEHDIVYDYSGNNNNGISSNVKFIDGIQGKAARLNGKNSFINFGNSNSLNFDGNMSIAFWIKRMDKNELIYSRILSKKYNWNDVDGYEFEYVPYLNKLNFCGGSKSSTEQGAVNYKLENDWTHIAAIHNNNEVIFYINGKYFGKDNYAVSPKPSNNDLIIGAMPSMQGYFNGVLDELYLFNRAISSEEVVRIYRGDYN